MIKEPIDAINFDCLPLLGFTTDVPVEGREMKEGGKTGRGKRSRRRMTQPPS